MNIDKHQFFLGIAKQISVASHATRNKVGALLEKDGNIIAFGYNGTPHGFDNECEVHGMTKTEVLHAESNAIAKCAKSAHNSLGSTLYVTTAPCYDCAKLIIQAGIKEVFYIESYRLVDGLNLLTQAGITHKQFELCN